MLAQCIEAVLVHPAPSHPPHPHLPHPSLPVPLYDAPVLLSIFSFFFSSALALSLHLCRQENEEAFLEHMKARFMRGEDDDVDYGAIDTDATLDDEWLDVRGRDAEEKYFDED